jgi:threonine 3-dehydrogenase
VLFSSTVGTYGLDIQGETIDDYTLQRPRTFYGITKVFGEHLGRFYRRKYGLDFRAVRYPSVVGPGVKTPGVAQYTSWMIEESARGRPFTIWVRPDTRGPVLYFKDAARAAVELAAAPIERIRTVAYLIAGAEPAPNAGELADLVRARLPEARLDFQPDPELQAAFDRALRPLVDRNAREEWGWAPAYDPEPMVDDFLRELRLNPQRYE